MAEQLGAVEEARVVVGAPVVATEEVSETEAAHYANALRQVSVELRAP